MKRLRQIALLTGTSIMFLTGCGMDMPETDGEFLHSLESGLSNSCTTPQNCDNCVYYARCRQRALPYGLYTYADKVRIINRSIPHPGCVAIIDTGNNIGHVAFVEYYNSWNGTVYISEGNWPWGECGSRSGSAGALNIRGYFCP